MENKKLCFVALPFSPTRSVPGKGTWTIVFERLIRPAVESYNRDGLTFSCEKQETRQGKWGEEIADKLLTADLAVIDLTDLNPNVCTELGIRLASGLPTIRIASGSVEKLGNLAGHGVMRYHLETSPEEFEVQLHASMEEVLSSSHPATWLSPERQLLSRRVQSFHQQAEKSLLAVSEVTATLSDRQDEKDYFFYDWVRFCRYWGKSLSRGSLKIVIEPSIFRPRSSGVTLYRTWPIVAEPLRHAAWPLFLSKDVERACKWLEEADLDVSIGTSPGEKKLKVDVKTERIEESLGDGTRVLIPTKVGEVVMPPDRSELALWIRFSGMFHPRAVPRMFFYPEGFVTERWSVMVDAGGSDLGCSAMPLGDRAAVRIRRIPHVPSTEEKSSIEISPRVGSLLLPTDGVLVSFFPLNAI